LRTLHVYTGEEHGEFNMKMATIGRLAGTALVLAGCGTDPGGRALSGAAIGAAGGAIIGAAAGNPGLGAAAGAVAGGAVGATTSPCDVDLNAPGGRQDCERRDRDRNRDRDGYR
jgi:osmotically inducible lipoprotein OsmB